MKNIKYVVIAAAVFSSGVFLGATGFDDAVAANNKTYKVVSVERFPEMEPALNEMAAQGWTFVHSEQGNLVFSK